eukprot:TRINITY_DN15306_c0_g1_i1.p1 TRINITY_DN15306_c0_g1~~TRINITY_DN15306_c0_g1_i1.p1  ORF type:complete len:316 (+),score=74.36 TRINITY_DN15306_c0_g1_i1:137-949(+)
MEIKAGQPPPYTSALDCAKKIVAKEGPLGLYRGMVAPLLGVTPMYALCFLGYGIGKDIFFKEDTRTNLTGENLFRIALAGATSGIFTTPILAPLERLKCLLQIQNANPDPNAQKFKGPIDLGRHIVRTEGAQALFRGYMATNLRDSLASMAYFSTYEYLKFNLLPADVNRSTAATVALTLICGGFAGIMNWVPAIPVDTLKSRLQTAPAGKYPHGIRSVAAEIYAQEGARAIFTFYRGVGPVFLRAFPANAACFLGYETTKKLLSPPQSE